MQYLLSLLALLLLSDPAQAILIDSGNGNTSEPPGGRGWDHVGWVGGLNGVYVGYGWVLTAHHVNSGNFRINNKNYPIVAASQVDFYHEPGVLADLKAVRVDPAPDLPMLPIRSLGSPGINVDVTLIGRGYNSDGTSSWGAGGWNWHATDRETRWGTNDIGGIVPGQGMRASADITIGVRETRSLVTDFDNTLGSEGVATEWDSGGGLFIENGGTWELAGIQFARTEESGQPATTSIYGNLTYSVDLSYYLAEVLDAVRPCNDGADNDGDGDFDYPDDEGCNWEGDMSEDPDCDDGLDNDFDGDFDYPDDVDCTSASDVFEEPDADDDLVADEDDNCLIHWNPTQLDSDLDGYGNACDADYDNDWLVATSDLLTIFPAFGSSTGEPNFNENVDHDGDGLIATADYLVFAASFGEPVGPSGLACAGTVPCP